MTGIKHFLTFILAAALLVGSLTLSALIPKTSIRGNMLESAEFLTANKQFGSVIPGIAASKIDRYADAILLGIAWQYDAGDPLKSVMRSAYYHDPKTGENKNLLSAVEEDLPANQQYLRYWHGSIALVRPLLLLLPVTGIYALNAVMLAALTLWLVLSLLRKKAFYAAGGILAGLAAVSIWFVPLSLEYTWTCLLSLALSLAALQLASRKKYGVCTFFFLITGMMTSFLDFLTTETLTLTLPLLLLLRELHREKPGTAPRLLPFAGTSVLSWGAGYGGMWALKWLLASAVLGENVLPYVSGHIGERLYGDVFGVDQFRLLTGAVTRNIGCLFPLGYGPIGAIAGIFLTLAAAYYAYVYRRKGYDRVLLFAYAAAGLLPYLRYLVLHNHSFIHYFFTFRAQAAAILAAALMLEELRERSRSDHGGRRQKK